MSRRGSNVWDRRRAHELTAPTGRVKVSRQRDTLVYFGQSVSDPETPIDRRKSSSFGIGTAG
ncbi:hypothetical protein AGR8A_pAt30044 [Agrobacterium fabrum str. J-07]|nr:hypothetical protein AGR8A_pAt30044 [Agrobacterium fabrum str. J-07]